MRKLRTLPASAGFCRLLLAIAMLTVSQHAAGQTTPGSAAGDLISSGPTGTLNNSWIFQTPDNSSKTLYIAPLATAANGSGYWDWNWPNGTEFRNTGDVRMSGRLAIGTNPDAMGTMRLAVEGKVGARAFHVTALSAAWPDYVFAPTYRLRPLAEVAEFVQTNCHLPDVPSAADVLAQGLDLGEMDARLLRKIEELTLYLLEQSKENAALKTRLERLENAAR